jgi:hypothetical protein
VDDRDYEYVSKSSNMFIASGRGSTILFCVVFGRGPCTAGGKHFHAEGG